LLEKSYILLQFGKTWKCLPALKINIKLFNKWVTVFISDTSQGPNSSLGISKTYFWTEPHPVFYYTRVNSITHSLSLSLSLSGLTRKKALPFWFLGARTHQATASLYQPPPSLSF
jgi:hypothetical protein